MQEWPAACETSKRSCCEGKAMEAEGALSAVLLQRQGSGRQGNSWHGVVRVKAGAAVLPHRPHVGQH
jgi:hypothetical protein